MSEATTPNTWICWGPAYGRCPDRHATREEAERHAWEVYREMKRYDQQIICDLRAHRSTCGAPAKRGSPCTCEARVA